MMEFSPDLVSLVKEISSGDENIYIVKFSNEIIISFKLPSHQKIIRYLALTSMADDYVELNSVYEAIFNEHVIDNSILKYGDIPAGIPESIAKLMFYLSGSQDVDSSINYTNATLNLLRHQSRSYPIDVMKRTICAIFPGYRFEDLDKLDLIELYRIFVNAEQLGLKRDIIEQELVIIKPEEIDNKPKSLDEIIKSSNKELHDLNNQNERVNIRDTAGWQKSYTNTARKLKR